MATSTSLPETGTGSATGSGVDANPLAALGAGVDDLQAVAQAIVDRGELDQVDPAAVQKLLALAISLHVARRQAGVDPDSPAVAPDAIDATEAVIVITDLLKAVNVNLFELTLWNGLGRAS